MATKARSAAASLNENETLSAVKEAATDQPPIVIDDCTFEDNTEAEKKLLRKIDMRLLPTIWLIYLLSYMVSRSVYASLLFTRAWY